MGLRVRQTKKRGAWRRPEKPLRRNSSVSRRAYSLLHPLAVKTYVETLALLFFGDAQADNHVDDLEDDVTADPRVHQGRANRAELHKEVGVRAADVLDIEPTGQQSTYDTADAVHAERVERIIVAEGLLDGGCREEAEHACGDADDECASDADETRRW